MKVKKVSANISLGERLKSDAQVYARSLEMDLSELVAQLLREELASPTIGQKKGSGVSGAIIGHLSTGSTAKPKDFEKILDAARETGLPFDQIKPGVNYRDVRPFEAKRAAEDSPVSSPKRSGRSKK